MGWQPPNVSFGDYIYGSGADGAFVVNQARTVTDGVLDGTGAVLAYESASANFTAADIGQGIVEIPFTDPTFGEVPVLKIASIVSPTKVLTNYSGPKLPNANPAITGLTLQIGGFIMSGQYTTLTIPAGVTARMSWNTYQLYDLPAGSTGNAGTDTYFSPLLQCTEAFVIDGTLDLTGPAAGLATIAPSNPASLMAPDSCSGGPGSIASTGAGSVGYGNDLTSSAVAGVGGGAGGNGASGAGGPGTPSGNSVAWPVPWLNPAMLFLNQLIQSYLVIGGATGAGISAASVGGSSGAGDGVNNGGSGGVAGQFVLIVARSIVHGANNLYKLQGGNGGNATAGNCGGGGGGGAGWWVTISDDIVGTANTSGTGGIGGSKSGTGTNGSNGSNGPGGVHFFNT